MAHNTLRYVSRFIGLPLFVGGIWASYHLAGEAGGRTLAYTLVLGLVLGFLLQRTRFCFLCHARDWHDHQDARGLLAIVLALAIGTIGYQIILSSWLPIPERLPPDAHIGPVSWALVLAGLAFGTGMVISGSCISAHLYRLGEGSPVAPFALIGTVAGFILGFNTWNALYSATIALAPVLWLPNTLGYGGTVLLQLGVLALLAYYLWRKGTVTRTAHDDTSIAQQSNHLTSLLNQLFTGRWAYWIGGIGIGLISVFIIIRTKPLGVTAAIGSLARRLGEAYDLVPARLDGLDGFAGCATVIQESWLTPNGVLVLGLIVGGFAAALASRQFAPRIPTLRDIARGLFGGLLLGWGSMTGLGCTIGNLLSGTMAGAVSGWVFGVSLFVAVWIGFKVQRRIVSSPKPH